MPKKASRTTPPPRAVKYVPPAAADLHTYVKNVCIKLGETLDPTFNTTDARVELEAFLTVVAKVYAKYLNQGGQSLDNEMVER